MQSSDGARIFDAGSYFRCYFFSLILAFFEKNLHLKNFRYRRALDMKIKFINFRNAAANSETSTHVPEKLIRKNWSLYAAEFYGFILGVTLIVLMSVKIIEVGIFDSVLNQAVLLLGLIFIAGSFLSALDNHWYRVIITASHMFLVISIVSFSSGIMTRAIFILPSILIAIALNFFAKNLKYYQWCKSLES